MITVTKEYRFEAAHRLMDHLGHCKNLHGHSYKVVVTVGCKDDKLNDNAMVLDFADLSQVVKREVVDKFDHAVVLYRRDPLADVLAQFDEEHMGKTMRIILLDAHPTAEYMAQVFAVMIGEQFTGTDIRVVRVEVWETSKAYATWDWTYNSGAVVCSELML